MRAARSIAALLIVVAAPARAQTEVRLRPPACEHLPFEPGEVRRLLALELSVSEAQLGEDGDTWLGYEPSPCAPGGTDFELELHGPAGVVHRDRVSMAEVPLASVPRALALALAETLRMPSRAPPLIEALPEVPHEAPPPQPPVAATPPEPVAEPPAYPHRPLRFGITAQLQNTPDTGAVLAGPRFFLDLPVADLPLLARIDVEAGIGPVAADLLLGRVGGGLGLSIWARASDVLAVRFGPRLWLGSASWFDTPGVDRLTELALQFGLEVRVGLDITLAPGVDLAVDASVGTHLHGLELQRGAERSGLLGAYWGADVGLAFY